MCKLCVDYVIIEMIDSFKTEKEVCKLCVDYVIIEMIDSFETEKEVCKEKEKSSGVNNVYTYGCEHNVQYDAGKSVVMYFDSRNANLAREMTLRRKKLNFAASCKYLGHDICNDLSDEADIQAKVRLLYANSNMLHEKIHFCSTATKNKLFTAYFSNIYKCALWVNC